MTAPSEPPETKHTYFKNDGSIHHVQHRRDYPDGHKKCWRDPTGVEGKYEILNSRGDLATAPSESTVYVVEGERCCDLLTDIGLVATTSGSCTSAPSADWRPLERFQKIFILPDNDEPGRKYADAVMQELAGLHGHREVFLCMLPELPDDGGDVADWLKDNYCRDFDWNIDPDPTRNALLSAISENAQPAKPGAIAHHVGDLRRRCKVLARYADADDIEGFEAAIEELRDDIRADESGTPLPIAKVADAGEIKTPLFAFGPVAGGFGLVIGGDGIGKGWLTLDLLMSCATATAVNVPKFACTARPLRCLYLCYEDDDRVLHWRLNRMSEAAGIDVLKWRQLEEDGRLVFVTDAAALFVQSGRDAPAQTETLRQLRAYIEGHDTDLCVIDPLSACAVLQNENDNAALNAVAVTLRRMAAETGCAVLLTHHTGKASRHLTGDHQAARGGSALGGAARWVLTLTEDADDRSNLIAAVAKNNYGQRVFDVRIRRNEDTGVLREVSGAELGRQNELLVEAAIAFFRAGPEDAVALNSIKRRNTDGATALVEALEAPPKACFEAVQTAIRQGALKTEKRKKRNGSGTCEYVVFADDNPGDTDEEDIPF